MDLLSNMFNSNTDTSVDDEGKNNNLTEDEKNSDFDEEEEKEKSIEFIPCKYNLLNQPGHEELLIEIYTFLTLKHGRSLATVDKRFHQITTDNKWLPNTILFSWGNNNHGHGHRKIQVPRMIQKFYTPIKRKQIKTIATSNNATFLLTYGGQVFYFGEFSVNGSISRTHHDGKPTLMEEFINYKICDLSVSCAGYFHGEYYKNNHISMSALTSDGEFFQWGLNNMRQLMLNESATLESEENYLKMENKIDAAKQKEQEENNDNNNNNNNSNNNNDNNSNDNNNNNSQTTTAADIERAAIHNYTLQLFRQYFNIEDSVDLNEEQLEHLQQTEERFWRSHLERRNDFVKLPAKCAEFEKKSQRIEQFSMGVYVSAVVTRGINDDISHVYYTKQRRSFASLRKAQRTQMFNEIPREEDVNLVCAEAIDFAGKEIKQIVCGGWFICVVDDTGNLYSLGDSQGPDISNGNLLGRGQVGRTGIVPSGMTWANYPKLVNFNKYNFVGAIKYVSASTYSALAIDENGRCYTWGDSDGYALGHECDRCHQPHLLHANIRGKDGSMSYTSGSLCTTTNELLVWGGKAWDSENAISEFSINSNYPRMKKVNWDVNSILKGYGVKKLLLGHRHAIVVCEKHAQ